MLLEPLSGPSRPHTWPPVMRTRSGLDHINSSHPGEHRKHLPRCLAKGHTTFPAVIREHTRDVDLAFRQPECVEHGASGHSARTRCHDLFAGIHAAVAALRITKGDIALAEVDADIRVDVRRRSQNARTAISSEGPGQKAMDRHHYQVASCWVQDGRG